MWRLVLLSVFALPFQILWSPVAAVEQNGPPSPARTSAAQPPPFTVVARQDNLLFYPCGRCHEFMPEHPLLVAATRPPPPHPESLNHGGDRLWCQTCHSLDDADHLRTLRGTPVPFDRAYLVCGQCHANRERDWLFGGHGKRVANWRGTRELYLCTNCHDPHDPTIKPRKPRKPPPLRADLGPVAATPKGPIMIWDERVSP